MGEPRDLIATERIPWYVTGFGAVVGLVVLAEVVVFYHFDVRDVYDGAFVVGSLTTVPAIVGLAYAGPWLRRSGLDPERYPRIGGWGVLCLVSSFATNAALIAAMPTESAAVAFSWLRWAVGIGAAAGVAVGILEARAIQRAVEAERAATRTEHVERQRDHLDYLNSVLRHEILNAATAIDGYASRLLSDAERLEPEQRRWLEIIIDETEDMSRVIDDVRVLLRRTTDDHEFEPVDVGTVLEDELRALENTSERVAVEASIPEDVHVRADAMLPRVYGNLLSNAVEHNDAETPRVEVDVERTPDAVAVEVADDGPGIPDEEIDSLFERGCNQHHTHGLGLYLVDELVADYGGTVELVETGPEGTRFRVELPRAPAEDGTGGVGTAAA